MVSDVWMEGEIMQEQLILKPRARYCMSCKFKDSKVCNLCYKGDLFKREVK